MLKKFITLIFALILLNSTTFAAPDPRTNLFCALSSMASYSSETNFLMMSMLKFHGWNVESIEENFQKTRVRAFLISNPNENFEILSICGTETQKDMLTDIRFGKISYNDSAAVHRGFLDYTDELLNLIRDKISKSNRKIIVTGHSLGGAVAILTSARLLDSNFPAERIEVVTFGAPSVGDKNFVDEFSNRMNLTRFEMNGDPIVQSLKPMGYESFGELVQLHPRATVIDTPHSMSLYLDSILRTYLDEFELAPISLEFDGEISNEDRAYITKILRDGIESNQFEIKEVLIVKKPRDRKNSDVLNLELVEFIYDFNGNLLTLHSQTSTTKDLTLLECAKFLQEKLLIERESILNR